MKDYSCTGKEIYYHPDTGEYREVTKREGDRLNYTLYVINRETGITTYTHSYTGVSAGAFDLDIREFGDIRCTSIPIE